MKSLSIFVLLLLINTTCLAQSGTEVAKDKASSKSLAGSDWLKQFSGSWTTKSAVGVGAMNSSTIGNRWIVNEYKGKVNGVEFVARQTLGYDERKKKFVGNWVDTTTSFQWLYTGVVQDSGKKLVLDTRGPDWEDSSKLVDYRDIYEIVSADEIKAISQIKNESGNWNTFMTSTMKKNAR